MSEIVHYALRAQNVSFSASTNFVEQKNSIHTMASKKESLRSHADNYMLLQHHFTYRKAYPIDKSHAKISSDLFFQS